MYQIWGRNHKNTLNLAYNWDNGDASTSSKLNKIILTADDNSTATLSFADFAATGGGYHRLLSTLAWPDTTIVTYHYDGLANLTQVDEPGNNVATTLKQSYTYTNASYLNNVLGPRYFQIGGQGGYFFAGYISTTSGKASMLCYHGYINPSIADGYSTGALQPSMPTGFTDWEDINLNYGGTVANATTITNTFGAKSVYAWDASNDRIDSVQSYKSSSAYLTASMAWNADNRPTSITDPRGNTTNLQYDATGKVVAIGQPQITSGGASFRPTSYLSYDANNNVVASCDPVWSHAAGKDWTTTPASSDVLCPTTDTGATRMTYTPTTDEPYGELTQIQRPATPASSAGFKAVIGYDAASQGGTDHGLPTSVTGDQFSQSDGTTNTPSTTLQYDAHGNVVCKNSGKGWTIAQYDTLNRPTAVADPDDKILTGCGKTAGSYTGVNYLYYYANGQVQLTETPAQHAAAKGVSYTYDADGNLTSVVHHHFNIAGTTNYYYDGGNRLVEVKSPKDTNDYYSFPPMRRYYYDISNGGTVTIGSASNLKAYGNHFLTQEYLAAATQSSPTPSGTAAWTTVSGKSYDMLNRPVSDYNLSTSNSPRVTRSYDASGQAGLLSSLSDGLGQQTTLAYDARSITNVSFSGDGGVTPARAYSHDPDGRVSAITSTGIGTQSYAYDKAGELTQSVEPSSTGITSPGTLSYTYYPNGARQAISVSSSGLTHTNLMAYSYRADGLLQTKSVALVAPKPFTWTYTNGGRMLSRNDPYTASVISNATSPYSGTYTLAPTTKVYDTYGRLSSQKIPMTGQYTNIGYDLEGNVDTYNGLYAPGDITGNYGNKQVNYGLNVRGELVALHHYTVGGTGAYDATWPHYLTKSANGFLYPVAESGSVAPPTMKFDALDGAVLQKVQTGSTKTYTWDTIGRQTRADLLSGTSSGNYTRTYDAEHHLLTHPYSTYDTPSNRPDCSGNDTDDGAYTATQTYKWGPNGHPLQMNGETLHWDGNQLLYTSNASGTVDNVKAGKLADINPSTLKMIVLDRDLSGVVVSTHNNEGFSGWNPPDAYGQRCLAGPPSSSSAYASAYVNTPFAKIWESAIDGITDGNNVVQGLRAYDPKTGQWVTPDGFSGISATPLTQKPYVWNGNNSMSFADPSGNDTIYVGFRPATLLGISTPFSHTFINIVRDDGASITFSAGPGGPVKLYLELIHNNNQDLLNTATNYFPIVMCQGICVGEVPMINAFYGYQQDVTLYGYQGTTSNSNSFAFDLLTSGGFDTNWISDQLAYYGAAIPGWGAPLSNGNQQFDPFAGQQNLPNALHSSVDASFAQDAASAEAFMNWNGQTSCFDCSSSASVAPTDQNLM